MAKSKIYMPGEPNQEVIGQWADRPIQQPIQPIMHGINFWAHSLSPWPQLEPDKLHEPSETDLMISDRFEELGFNYLAQVFRGTALMPQWVVRLMQNGPDNGWSVLPTNDWNMGEQPNGLEPQTVIIDELSQPEGNNFYRERTERVIDARD